MAEYQDFISSLTGEEIEARLLAVPNKVDKEEGKGLSSNDYTGAEKAKLEGVETGAQKNPGNATTSTPGLMSATDKEKLDGVAVGANKTVIDATLTHEGQAADASVTGAALTQQKSIIDDLTDLTNRKAGALIDTASGAIASFVPDSTIPDLLGVTVDVEPVQAGSGDPSPDNVRPISGRDAVGIEATGENLLDQSTLINASLNASNGAIITGTANRLCVYKLPVPENSTITASIQRPYQFGSVCFYDLQGNYISSQVLSNWAYDQYTYNIPDGAHFFTATVRQDNNANLYPADVQLKIETGSTATEYKPYTGTTHTIALGQTVYGGTLDVTAGTMSVRPYYSSYNGEALVGPWISSMDVFAPGATPTVGAQVVDMGGAVAEITLDPVTIAAIAGQTNNVWADAGDVSVEFAADLKHYIDSKIAAAVAAMS